MDMAFGIWLPFYFTQHYGIASASKLDFSLGVTEYPLKKSILF